MPGKSPQLPDFGVEAWATRYQLTCERPDCEGVFDVEAGRFLRSSDYQYRPCPYCFRVSRIPTRYWELRAIPVPVHPDDDPF